MPPPYPNPLTGVIHPKSWVRPAGNTEWKVTSDAYDHTHRATPGPPALDISDGDPDSDSIMAMAAGVILETRLSDGVVRLREASGWVHVYAHCLLPHIVRVGQAVTAGQIIGRVSNTHPSGTLAPHLHLQLGLAEKWEDPWPLLAQNGDTVVIVTAQSFTSPSLRWKAPTTGTYTAYKIDGTAKSTGLSAGSGADADYLGSISRTDGKQPSGGGWLHTINGAFADMYIAASTVTTPLPLPTWQVEAGKQKARAEKIKAKTAAYAADVSDE